MLSKLRARLTYANVISSIALFLALTGGTAVALSGTNTVFSDDIAPQQVQRGDVKIDPWRDLPLASTWERNADTMAPPGYAKDAEGWVNLRGVVGYAGASPCDGERFARLPVGYRPVHDVRLNGNGAGSTYIYGTHGGDPARAGWVGIGGAPCVVNLDGLRFRTGQ